MIRTKRVYDPVEPDDGARFLVDRLWPRGRKKDALHLDEWLKDAAPSDALRRWFGHDPRKWEEFQRRYFAELDAKPESWRPLLEAARWGILTLLYSARSSEHNNAAVLKEYLDAKLGGASTPEWLCRQIVEGSQDGIIVADRGGTIRLWNSGAEAMFGYQAEEALGETLDLIIPERLRIRHWEGYQRVMATGVTRYGRDLLAVPAIRKDGARISLEFTIVLLRDATREPMGAAAIIRNVTARWQEEKALKERLATLEAEVASQDKPSDER